MLGEEEQQVELDLGQRRLLAVDEHAAGGAIDLERAEAQRLGAPIRLRVEAAEHGVDAGDQLGRGERLDHVVVGAEAQAQRSGPTPRPWR